MVGSVAQDIRPSSCSKLYAIYETVSNFPTSIVSCAEKKYSSKNIAMYVLI